MAKSEARVRTKYSAGVSGAGPEYEAGLKETDKKWDEGYVKSVPYMKRRLDEAFAAKRPEKGARALGHEGFVDVAVEKGRPSYEGAATRATEAYMLKYPDIARAADEAKAAIRDLPTTTRQQRIARSSRFQEEVGKFWDRKKGIAGAG